MTDDKEKAREEAKLRNQLLRGQYVALKVNSPYALQDLLDFIQGLATTYRRFAEEQDMAGVPLDDHKVNQFLQQARTCDTIRTYITNRTDDDVAQPVKKSK